MCTNCTKVQSKLNPGDLCKTCFESKSNNEYIVKDTYSVNDDTLDSDLIPNKITEEREFIDIIKEHMIKEQQQQQDYIELLHNQMDYLKKDIEFLKKDITHKNIVIENLVCDKRIGIKTNYINSSLTNADSRDVNDDKVNEPLIHFGRDVDDGWNTRTRNNSSNKLSNKINQSQNILIDNRYRYLIVDDDAEIVADSNFDEEGEKYIPNQKLYRSLPKVERRPNVVVNKFQENDKATYVKKVLPGNSKYSDMIRKGKKVCIFSDSICKRVDMVEFAKELKYKDPVKRSFPGATASQLKYFVMPSLFEDSPDVAIIHVGINNILKKYNQSEMEIFNEIMEVVGECNRGGVSDIYVSSIICNISHQEKINAVNKLLQTNSFKYKYQFIENSNIKSNHLWRDRLHLNDDGICILSKNYLEHLNRSYVYDNQID